MADFKPLNVREWLSFIWWDIRGKSQEWWDLHRPEGRREIDAIIEDSNARLLKAWDESIARVSEAAVDGMMEIMKREIQKAQVEYYNAGHMAGLREGWNAAKAGEVFPAVDGPARAEARRIFESRPDNHPPMKQAELAAELKARLGDVSGKTLERVWKTARAEHPEKTKGPGRPKNTAPISE